MPDADLLRNGWPENAFFPFRSSTMVLRTIRNQYRELTSSIERRIVTQPYADADGEKGLWAWISHAPQHRITHIQISVEGWPKTSSPLRIAFISDLHTGSHTDDVRRLESILEMTAQLKPDIFCLGGDYTNGMPFGRGRVPPTITAAKLSCVRAQHGSFAILGDHDLTYGSQRVIDPMRVAGLDVLVNDVRSILHGGAEIHVVGVTPDARELGALLGGLPAGSPAIVLAHDPAAFIHLPGGPFLMLSGHTHGGQIQLPFVGPLVNMSDAPLRWTYGHIAEGGRHLYVTSGIGTSGIPLRLGIPPEIVLIEVIHAEVSGSINCKP